MVAYTFKEYVADYIATDVPVHVEFATKVARTLAAPFGWVNSIASSLNGEGGAFMALLKDNGYVPGVTTAAHRQSNSVVSSIVSYLKFDIAELNADYTAFTDLMAESGYAGAVNHSGVVGGPGAVTSPANDNWNKPANDISDELVVA